LGFLLIVVGCAQLAVPKETPGSLPQQVQSAVGGAAVPAGTPPDRQTGSKPADVKIQDPAGSQNRSPAAPEKGSLPGLLAATVTYVVDGDTVHVVLADGREEKVRFIGVDTPESTKEVEPYGMEAAAYTKSRLDGRRVWLEKDVAERDKYGRLLAYVWLSPPENDGEAEVRAKMFNAELLLEGYAQVMTVPPNVKYADLFAELQREAREAQKGLWGSAAAAGGAVSSTAAAKGVESKPNTEAKYIGNARSKKFHLPDCKWAEKIAPRNRVEFRTRHDAVAAGYEPCKVCRP
jgi:micrococcal nuclease